MFPGVATLLCEDEDADECDEDEFECDDEALLDDREECDDALLIDRPSLSLLFESALILVDDSYADNDAGNPSRLGGKRSPSAPKASV